MSRLRRLVFFLQPYWLHLYLLVYTPLVLYLDSRVTNFWQQLSLGLVTLAVLWLCSRSIDPSRRLQVWACVMVATGFEVLGSQVWGVYRYRWHDIPLYVPPGHGLVYWFGLTAGALPIFQRHGRRVALAVLAACSAWTLAGLTLLPLFTHRLDLQGALCWPVFAWCILRSRRYALYAALFVATTDLELAGTLAGDWTWLPVAPWDHVPSGNPPSAVAGGYSIIDGSVALVVAALGRLAPAIRTALLRLRRGVQDSRWRRIPSNEEAAPSITPASSTSAPAARPLAGVSPGANAVSRWAAPTPAASAVTKATTALANSPATAPVRAPSTTNGPRTIQRGAPTSCMMATSSRRAWMAERMLLPVTMTATRPSTARKVPPAPPSQAIADCRR